MNSEAGLWEVGCLCGTGGRYCSERRQARASLFGPGVTG